MVTASLFVNSLQVSFLLVFLTLLLWNICGGPIVATLYSVVSPSMRAMAGSASTLLSSLLGFGLGPFCVGWLSDMLAPAFGAESLRYALLAPIALIPVLVIGLYSVARALPNDLRVREGRA
jgi:MFS family permease